MRLRRFIVCALLGLLPAAPAAGAEPGESAAPAAPRVISLYAAHTEVLLRLGARDNIIGVSAQETYAGPEAEGWSPPIFSFRDDVEKYLAAKPDIVLVRPQHVAGAPRMKEALERSGIRVLALQVARAEGLYDYWRELAGLVGRGREGERMVASFDAAIRPYREAAAGRADAPGVFLEAVHREVKTFAPDSIPVWLVGLAGGRNVASDAASVTPGGIIADYGPERLLARADEVDLFISQEGAMNRAGEKAILEREIYQPLGAVREGRVHKIPEAVLSRPTPSLLEGLRLLAGWTGLAEEAGL